MGQDGTYTPYTRGSFWPDRASRVSRTADYLSFFGGGEGGYYHLGSRPLRAGKGRS